MVYREQLHVQIVVIFLQRNWLTASRFPGLPMKELRWTTDGLHHFGLRDMK